MSTVHCRQAFLSCSILSLYICSTYLHVSLWGSSCYPLFFIQFYVICLGNHHMVCVRACVRVCVHACVRACVHACVMYNHVCWWYCYIVQNIHNQHCIVCIHSLLCALWFQYADGQHQITASPKGMSGPGWRAAIYGQQAVCMLHCLPLRNSESFGLSVGIFLNVRIMHF